MCIKPFEVPPVNAQGRKENLMNLDPGGLIAWLVVGLIAGWLAGQFMKGGGYGLVGDIVLGIIGAFALAASFQPAAARE